MAAGKQEDASGRVDILAKRIVERLVSKTGNLSIMGAYARIQPLTDAVIDSYLGGLTLEDLAVEGAERVASGAKRVRKRVTVARKRRRKSRAAKPKGTVKSRKRARGPT